MKKVYLAVVVSSAALMLPGLAAAESFNYASVNAGISQIPDTNVKTTAGKVRNLYDRGFNVSAAVGREYEQSSGFAVRAEVELGRTEADVDNHRLGGVAQIGAEGDFSLLTGFVSLYGASSMNLIPDATFLFGTGAGLVQVSFEDYGTDSGGVLMDDDDVTYGFHFTTGISYPLTDLLDLEGSFRYVSAENVDLKAEDGTSTSQRVESLDLRAGVRLRF
ncbi:MAG: hypothetical protein R3296_11760 [Oleiphilaceae bacterium]|nr:hypothetical protein [Oleiphilaceae bacterium]